MLCLLLTVSFVSILKPLRAVWQHQKSTPLVLYQQEHSMACQPIVALVPIWVDQHHALQGWPVTVAPFVDYLPGQNPIRRCLHCHFVQLFDYNLEMDVLKIGLSETI
jgi:hypothetical protein